MNVTVSGRPCLRWSDITITKEKFILEQPPPIEPGHGPQQKDQPPPIEAGHGPQAKNGAPPDKIPMALKRLASHNSLERSEWTTCRPNDRQHGLTVPDVKSYKVSA